MRVALALAVALLATLSSRSAFAARAGTVDVDGVELREGPGSNYKVVDKLAKGTPVAASNVPIDGFYKIRTGTGSIGFVPADSLVLQPIAQDDIPAQAPPPQGAVPSETAKATLSTETGFRNKNTKKYVRLRAMGGYNFFSVSDVNNQLGANVLQGGYNAGGEIGFLFSQDLAFVIRVEQLFKSVFAQDQKTLKSFTISTTSTPVMAGLDLALTSGTKWSSRFLVVAGIGVFTGVSATDLSDPAPNTTNMSSIAFAGTAALDLTYSFNKTWAVFAEGGYRYVQTPQVTPSTTVNGSQIFQVAGTGNYAPIAINLSGFLANLGASFTF